MGSRDYRNRETKKQKKDAKKLPPVVNLASPPPEVEVIRKGKKNKDWEET